jgi:hypothetical protein
MAVHNQCLSTCISGKSISYVFTPSNVFYNIEIYTVKVQFCNQSVLLCCRWLLITLLAVNSNSNPGSASTGRTTKARRQTNRNVASSGMLPNVSLTVRGSFYGFTGDAPDCQSHATCVFPWIHRWCPRMSVSRYVGHSMAFSLIPPNVSLMVRGIPWLYRRCPHVPCSITVCGSFNYFAGGAHAMYGLSRVVCSDVDITHDVSLTPRLDYLTSFTQLMVSCK